jgi:hypothetical protein
MDILSTAMIRNFLTKLVRTVRTVVPTPHLRVSVVTVIERTCLVVDLLTGVYRPRPVEQQTGREFLHQIPLPVRIFSSDIPLFFRQR